MSQRPISSEQVAQIVRLHGLGGTQRGIAAEVGVSQKTVSNYLNGRYVASHEAEVGRIASFDTTDLGGESLRVVEYVNHEIRRLRAGERTEPVDIIISAARRRLDS